MRHEFIISHGLNLRLWRRPRKTLAYEHFWCQPRCDTQVADRCEGSRLQRSRLSWAPPPHQQSLMPPNNAHPYSPLLEAPCGPAQGHGAKVPKQKLDNEAQRPVSRGGHGPGPTLHCRMHFKGPIGTYAPVALT
jgi:hypothetical protein